MKQKQGIIIASTAGIIIIIGIIAQLAMDIMAKNAALDAAAQFNACQGFPQGLICWVSGGISGFFSPIGGLFGGIINIVIILVVVAVIILGVAFQQGWVKW